MNFYTNFKQLYFIQFYVLVLSYKVNKSQKLVEMLNNVLKCVAFFNEISLKCTQITVLVEAIGLEPMTPCL